MELIHRLISFLLLFITVPLHIFICILRLVFNIINWMHWQNFWKYDLKQPDPLLETGQVLFEELRYSVWIEILMRIVNGVWYAFVMFINELSALKTIKI